MRHAPLPPDVVSLLAIQHGVITRTQIHSLGYRDGTRRGWLARHLLVALHAGAYSSAEQWQKADDRQRLLMRLLAVQLAAPDAMAYATTAATVLRLPTRALPRRPEVARSPGASRLTSCRVRRVVVPVENVVTIGGLSTTDLERTAIDVAAAAPLPDALITVDAALRRGADHDVLTYLLATRAGQPGAARAARALAAGSDRSESPLESLSRGRMIEIDLPAPECNVDIRHDGRLARVDFWWAQFGVVGECDGKGKYDKLNRSGDALWREKRRAEWLEDLGLEVVRWGYPEVADNATVMCRRFWRAVERQRRSGWALLPGVDIDSPLADSCAIQPLWTP